MNRFVQSCVEPRYPGLERPLTIGLLNNSSDRSLRMTERQFLGLVRAACPAAALHFRFFTCTEVLPQERLQQPYAYVDRIFDTHLDALIVTGMEPHARRLQDEPVWNKLARVVDWAQDHAVPVIWSCLAAHAAVLYLDGIERVRLPEKLSGVFECERVSADHLLMNGFPSRWISPHSRYHDLPEEALLAKGYRVLSKSSQAGVDIFLKQDRTSFVFFQGHPEYEADSILLEYKRDIRRYLSGEKEEYPPTPKNYLDAALTTQLDLLRNRAVPGVRDHSALAAALRLLGNSSGDSSWQPHASRFYTNWVSCLLHKDLHPPPSMLMQQEMGALTS